MVVEGGITDQPGPYTVLVSQGVSINSFTLDREPVRDLDITLYDDLGNSERLSEAECTSDA